MRRLFAVALLVAAACAKPVPADKAAYVGEWEGTGMDLLITKDGSVVYRRLVGAVKKSIDAPLKEFQGDDFVVGIGPMKTTFIVSVPPHREGSFWRMTVDSVELTRKP